MRETERQTQNGEGEYGKIYIPHLPDKPFQSESGGRRYMDTKEILSSDFREMSILFKTARFCMKA